jgi:flagellar protein FlgJ
MQEIALALAAEPGNTPGLPNQLRTAAQIQDVALKFEAVFVAEMLRHTGLGEVRDTFGGGVGEAGFSGFLIQAYAEKISETGRLGIADGVYRSLEARIQE